MYLVGKAPCHILKDYTNLNCGDVGEATEVMRTEPNLRENKQYTFLILAVNICMMQRTNSPWCTYHDKYR